MTQKAARTRLGVEAENMGRPALDPGVVAMARAIEAAGAESISVSDHLLSFAPAGEAGSPGPEAIWLEALSCLAAISSVTERVNLVASVVILPQRNVLELMKAVTTIDTLSQGRLVLGVGSGWNAREMTALGYDFASRGQRMDEMLQVLRSLQGDRVPPFSGAHLTVPEGIIMTPPAWPGHAVPIYIGGSGVSAPSLRRTLAYGDGWMPYAAAGEYDADALRATLSHLRGERARQGKPLLDTIFKLHVSGHADPALERDAAGLAALGFDEVIIQGIWDAGLEPGLDAIRRARAALDT
ncbi:MAG: TIGR03619 family F420-dependent LLM class oxidoreductase [Thermomicrobiales bacterium]|nr:TIGR03619 family F420-dependent LLM class oxidoreductase [Thermomicrobiales bacterium]